MAVILITNKSIIVKQVYSKLYFLHVLIHLTINDDTLYSSLDSVLAIWYFNDTTVVMITLIKCYYPKNPWDWKVVLVLEFAQLTSCINHWCGFFSEMDYRVKILAFVVSLAMSEAWLLVSLVHFYPCYPAPCALVASGLSVCQCPLVHVSVSGCTSQLWHECTAAGLTHSFPYSMCCSCVCMFLVCLQCVLTCQSVTQAGAVCLYFIWCVSSCHSIVCFCLCRATGGIDYWGGLTALLAGCSRIHSVAGEHHQLPWQHQCLSTPLS